MGGVRWVESLCLSFLSQPKKIEHIVEGRSTGVCVCGVCVCVCVSASSKCPCSSEGLIQRAAEEGGYQSAG